MSTLNAVRSPELIAADMTQQWRQRAACRGRSALMDPPEGLDGDERGPARIAARAVCDACPVLAECTRWVMPLSEQDDPGGMCAGMTPHQRKAARLARLRIRPTKTCSQCGETKPSSEFYAAKSKDGLRAACKACALDQTKARRAKRTGQAAS